jgi:acyl-coenzyme A synthetase/AMP-(fatty) acid ligase
LTVTVEVPERYNASTLLDRNLERGLGEKVCLRWEDQELTYAQVYRQVCAFGRALRALGVRREERVLLVLDDSPAFPVAFLGAIRVGAVPIPTNPLLRADDYAYFLQNSCARVVVTDLPLLPTVREAVATAPEPPPVVVSRGRAEGAWCLEELVSAHEGELSPADTHRDDMAFWLYSSGSTGRPKGVVHLQHDILYTCETYARHVLRITQDDVTFSASKLFHAYGLGNNLSFPYWAGASTVLRSGRPTPEGVLETIQRYRPTLFFGVPTLYNAILNFPEADRYDLSSVRLCVSAAEALPAEIFHRWKERFGAGDSGRGGVHGDAPHLLLQHPGDPQARVLRQAGAGVRAEDPLPRHRAARGPRGSGGPVRPRGQRAGPVLAPAREDQAQPARGLVLHGGPLPRGRGRLLLVRGAQRRHDQGGRAVGVARGD